MPTADLTEYRCRTNKKLLCKATGQGHIEIMNPSNRYMNYVGPTRVHQDIGPKGVDFQQLSVDLNCKTCRRLLGRAIGIDLIVEVKCKYCKAICLFDLEEMQRPWMAPLSNEMKKQYELARRI